MFRNLKRKFANVALVVLAMQLAFVGVGVGGNTVHAVAANGGTNIQTTYADATMTVGQDKPFVNTVTLQGTAYGEAAYSQAYGVVVITRLDDTLTPILASDAVVSLNSQVGTEVPDSWLLDAVKQANASNPNMLVLGWNPFTLLPDTFTSGVTSDFDVTISKAGTYLFQNQIYNETVLPSAGIVSATPEDAGNVITVQAPPTLTSVTATFDGTPQTKLASEYLTAVLGQTVGTITAQLSSEVSLVGPLTEGQITISGAGIPIGTPYGTFVVDSTDTSKIIITPSVGNDVLGLVGDLTFTVAASTVQDVFGNVNPDTTFDLSVYSDEITAIGSVAGTPQVGNVLTAGALTPATATATYQWQSSVTAVGGYTNILGATGSTFTLTTSELGKYIRVVATGTSPYTGMVESLNTTVVVASPVAPAAVTDVVATVDADGHVVLTWTNPPAGTYNSLAVYRLDGSLVALLAPGVTTYTDILTTRGNTYAYTIGTFNQYGNKTLIPSFSVTVPAAVVAAAVSDTTSYDYYQAPEEDTNTDKEEVKALEDEKTVDNTDETSDEPGFPTWGILLLIILAAVGGYLIWSQKAEPIATPAPVKKKTSTPKK